MANPMPANLNVRYPKPSRRSLRWIVPLVLAVAIFIVYGDRRTPVESQSGTGISWPDDVQPKTKTPFKVATYNIHRGKGTDGIHDVERTAGVLRDADLVGLNEAGGPALPGGDDQAEQLGRILQTGWLFAPNQRRWYRYHFGNGMLSRLPVETWRSEPLIYDAQTSQSYRNLLTAEVLIDERPITVMITHLDRGPIRSTQLGDVLDAFETHSPAILMGDFNTDASDPLLAEFFTDSNNVDAIKVAMDQADQTGRIDWIITRGLTVLSGGMEPVGVSDHPCYWVDVEVPPMLSVSAGSKDL